MKGKSIPGTPCVGSFQGDLQETGLGMPNSTEYPRRMSSSGLPRQRRSNVSTSSRDTTGEMIKSPEATCLTDLPNEILMQIVSLLPPFPTGRWAAPVLCHHADDSLRRKKNRLGRVQLWGRKICSPQAFLLGRHSVKISITPWIPTEALAENWLLRHRLGLFGQNFGENGSLSSFCEPSASAAGAAAIAPRRRSTPAAYALRISCHALAEVVTLGLRGCPSRQSHRHRPLGRMWLFARATVTQIQDLQKLS